MNKTKKIIILITALISVIALTVVVIFNAKRDHSISTRYYGEYDLTVDEETIRDEGHLAEIITAESTFIACNEKLYDFSLIELDFEKEAYLISHGRPIESILTTSFRDIKIYGERGRVIFIKYKDGEFPFKDYIYIIDNSGGPYWPEQNLKYLPE